MKEKSLETIQYFPRIYKIAQIVALLCTPIVVSIIGWGAQKSTTESGIQRDLVQTAVHVLRSPRGPEDLAIRDWATEIMSKYSPVPFSKKEADQLSPSVFSLLDKTPLLKRRMEARPSCPTIDIKTLSATQGKDVQQLQELCARYESDLFWLKVFIGLAREPSYPTAPVQHPEQ